MKTYDVFHHQDDGYEAVKRGFSWPAFFFGWLWAVAKDLNFAVFGLLGASVALVYSTYHFQESGNLAGALLLSLSQIAFVIWTGFCGNKWRRKNLLKRGFLAVDAIAASSSKQAISKVDPASKGDMDHV